MNKNAILGIGAVLTLMLLLAACGSFGGPSAMPPPPSSPAAPQPAPPPSQPPASQPVATPPAVTVNPPPAASPLSADGKKLQGLFAAADGRLKSYKYFYSDRRPDPNIKFPVIGDFQIKGDKIRIDIKPVEELSARQANVAYSDASLYQPQLYGDDYYDQFFLHMGKQIAYTRCANQLCRRDRDTLAQVSYTDFYRKTPLDWRKEIPLESAQIIDNKQIQGQSITRVSYTAADGIPVVQWLEGYSMVPIRVDVGDDKTGYTIHFTNLAPNSVSENVFVGVPI